MMRVVTGFALCIVGVLLTGAAVILPGNQLLSLTATGLLCSAVGFVLTFTAKS